MLAALLIILLLRHLSAKRLQQKNRELEQKNEELKLANERAEESSKMKTAFIKSISHEIRTPLNVLSGFTQIITTPDTVLPPEQLKSIHQRINENTDRITSLVNKMLDLSEASSHAVVERTDQVTAMQVADQAVHNSRLIPTEQVKFHIEADEDTSHTSLTTTEHYAVRALSLLLDNAQKFTAKGHILLKLQRQGQFMSFIVEDTGIGIPADQADNIFEEFVQLDKYSEGTGIGLPIARSIARRLGGDITLDTSYTDGARFVMTLPV